MTQFEQDADLALATKLIAGASFTVDRCRHASIEETALWIFSPSGKQVGSATRQDGGWRANRIANGLPVSHRIEPTLGLALSHIVNV